MKQENLIHHYDAFFVKSEAGKYFIEQLTESIEECHSQAEKQPDRARDMAMKASAAREILAHINSVLQLPKKGSD